GHTAGEISRTLCRSSGAVGNALELLASRGQATLTGTNPRRYEATPTTRTALTGPAAIPTPRPAPTPAPVRPAGPPPPTGRAAGAAGADGTGGRGDRPAERAGLPAPPARRPARRRGPAPAT